MAEGGARSLITDELNNVTVLEEGTSAMDYLNHRAHGSFGPDDQNAFYVADLGDVVEKYYHFCEELPRVKPFYAVKCNDSKEVLQLLAVLGTGFDCFSKAEMDQVLSIGVPGDNIIYGNTCKQPSFIRHAAHHNISKMTFDCESELFKIAKEYPEAKMILRIVVNDAGSLTVPNKKYGASLYKCEDLLRLAYILRISVIGVSFHVGTLSKRPQAFRQAISDAKHVFDLGRKFGHEMNLLDIGGGFPGDDDFKPIFEEFSTTINKALELYFPDTEGVKIISTSGRYFVASTFTAAVNVIGKKAEHLSDGKRISYFLNDGIFGTFWPFEKRYLKLKLLKDYPMSYKRYSSRLWGPCCTDTDLILEDANLPELKIGEWIVFLNMGAYSITKTSTFNGFLPPTIYYTMSRDQFDRIQRMLSLDRQ